MIILLLCLNLILISLSTASIDSFAHDFGYIDVRDGAHIFYVAYHTTNIEGPRPLLLWLHGGPGDSSVGRGNFGLIGPLDEELNERNTSWIKDFNLLFVDAPVGAGFSFVDDLIELAATNDKIAEDLVNFMREFYTKHPEFENVPLYIFGQFYGGKIAVDLALKLHEAIQINDINIDFRGILLGNSWISPIDSTLSWGAMLDPIGHVDADGASAIDVSARQVENFVQQNLWVSATNQWLDTYLTVLQQTFGVNVFNIVEKNERIDEEFLEIVSNLFVKSRGFKNASIRDTEFEIFMNTVVREAFSIPDHVTWGSQADDVFIALFAEFLKPVTESLEKILSETNLKVTLYNGNLDLICNTLGQLAWVDRLNWPGAVLFKNATREPVWVNNTLEGYYQGYDRLHFYWINVAGQNVATENPAGMSVILEEILNSPSSARTLQICSLGYLVSLVSVLLKMTL